MSFRCREKPLCKLPSIQNKKGWNWVHTVQVPGALASDVEHAYQMVKAGDRPPPPDKEAPPCELMLIGEAPGYNEDKYGWPFCGEAGGVLNWFLNKAGFDLTKVLITNIVRCRPPKNRDPSAEEIKACSVHILEEIKRHQPKVIMLLGLKALKLFNLTRIGDMKGLHGQVFEKKLPAWPDGPTFKIIPTYHPASFLHKRNERQKRRILDDYFIAKRILLGDTPDTSFYQAKYEVIRDADHLREVVDKIKKAGLYAMDTESVSLGFRKHPMITIQLSIGEGNTWVLPMYNHDPEGVDWKLKPAFQNGEKREILAVLGDLLQDKQMQVIGVNFKYDLNVIEYWTGSKITGWIWDIQLMHHLIDARPPHDLEYLADLVFASGPYSNPVKDIVGYGKKSRKTMDNVPDQVLWPYGATDAELTYRLFPVFYKEMSDKALKIYSEETHPAIRTTAAMEWRGVYINQDALAELEGEYTSELDSIADRCRAITKPGFNPGSPEQVAEALLASGFDEVRAPEKSKGWCSDKNVLQTIQDRSELSTLVMKYRSLNKIVGTYLENAIEDLNDDGRLRYSFWLDGTASGRLSNKFFHQLHGIDEERVKAGKYVMRDLVAAEPGHALVAMDYSQIELRIMAIISGDELFLSLFEKGIDVHEATTASALSIPLDKVGKYNRTHVGKRINFGVIYGSHGYSVSKGDYIDPETGNKVPIGMEKVQQFIRGFRTTYPGIAAYIDSVPHMARINNCTVESVFGRARHIPELESSDQGVRGEAERQAVNHTIQSPAGTITIRTANMVGDYLADKNIPPEDIGYILQVHDSLIYDIKLEHLKWFVPKLREIASRPIPELGGYRFPVDIGVGSTWAKAELAAKEN